MNHSETESTTDARPVEPALADLDRLEPAVTLTGRNRSKAVLRRFDVDGDSIAVKDYRGSPAWIRATVGRYLIRRETLGYRWAGPVAGLPRFLGRLGPVTLATAWVDAVPLARLRQQDDALFDRLDRILDELHRRHLALADLHHRDVLVSADGAVHVVDLAMAYRFRERPAVLRPVRRWLFRHLCRLDRIAAARMRARFTGGDPEQAAERVGGGTSRWYRAGRKLKGLLRRRRK